MKVTVELRDGYWHIECDQLRLHAVAREGYPYYERFCANAVALALRELAAS